MKRHVCIILSLVLFVSLIVACGESKEPSNKSNETTASGITEEPTAKAAAETTRQPLDVPKNDYGGYQFNILSIHSTISGLGTFPGANYYSDFTYFPERVGEPINDAIYARNLKISEEYGVEINNTEVADVYTDARKIILAAEDVYDIVTPVIEKSFLLAQEKLIYNLNNVPFLNLNNPWWDQVMIEKLSLNNKLYSIVGDISMHDEEQNTCFYVNKVLMEEYKITNIYDLVRDGKWTIDKVREIGLNITRDLNGDGILDWNDMYAFGNNYTGSVFFFNSTGENFATLDKNGYPQLTIGTERAINAMDKIIEFFNDKNFMLWADDISAATTKAAGVGGWTYFRTMFKENRLLILLSNIFAAKELRDMFDDFAMMPAPKFDERQDKYYMVVATEACPAVCIPITAENIERTGILLEAIAYYSKPIQEAYTDVTLMEKFARDADSRDMLELIFSNRTYDIGKAFGWGNYAQQIRNAVQANKSFVSYYEANREKAETEIAKTFALFSEID